MDKTLMILGLGGVGTYAAHLAGRLPGVRVAVGDIRADHARQVANSLIADSYFLQEYRRFPEVAGFGIDMLDTEARCRGPGTLPAGCDLQCRHLAFLVASAPPAP